MDNEHLAEAYKDLNNLTLNLLDSFSALSALSSIDLRHVDEPELLHHALKILIQNLVMNKCSVFLLEDDHLVNYAGLDWDGLLNGENIGSISFKKSLTASVAEGIMGLAVRTKKLQHCRNCATDPNFKVLPEQTIGSLISVPIFQAGGDVLGVLNISHPQADFFNEWHERFLLVYCNCLGQLLVSFRLLNHMETEVAKRTNQLKQALEDAQEKKEELRLFKTVIDSSQEAVAISDSEGMPIYINPAHEKLFGRSLEQLRCKTCSSCSATEATALDGTLMNGAEIWEGELEATDVYGRHFPMWRQSGAVCDARNKMLYRFDFMRDISQSRQADEEKRHLEAQLNHARKMEAVGQLAGGVAHDFSNILTTIIGYSHIMIMKMDASDPLIHFVNHILSASERATSLTQSLLTFSRKQIINPQLLNINEAIARINKLLIRLIREDIEYRSVLTEKRLTVMADVGQLEQVLMNLATNARDAMPQGGTLTVSTDIAELDSVFIHQHGYGKKGTYATISIADTGTGMDETTRQKIFEPFYTTKEVGKGTGLGLAIAYGSVKQQNGYIIVDSVLGQGSVFKIYLPLVSGYIDEEQKSESPAIKKGSETVLIAEDDDNVRKLNRALLESYGYRVLEAVDGNEALHIFEMHGGEIDLLVLDVVMPKLNGKEVYDEIRRRKPDMKALFTSGYAADIIGSKGIQDEELNIMAKPLSPIVFLKKVRDILDMQI
jgi:two-component system, cell cycle sensor histidine kinase and response regulator CckA